MTENQDVGRSPEESRHVETALKMFNDGWGTAPSWQDVWRAHSAADMVGYFNGEPEPSVGLDSFLTFQEGLFEGFPDIKTRVTAVTAEGETVVVQSMLEGVQSGPFLGVPPSNNRVEVPDVTIFRFADGKIREVRYFTDLLAVMTTVGAVDLNA